MGRAHGTDYVVVVRPEGRLEGWVSLHDLERGNTVADAPLRRFAIEVRAEDSLRAALNAMVTGSNGIAVRVSGDRRYEGILTQELLSKEIR